jgi:threonine synthase
MTTLRSRQIFFHNTNDRSQKVTFQKALMDGQAPNYGLYMIDRKDVPKLDQSQIREMKGTNLAEIATAVLMPYLQYEIEPRTVEKLMQEAYNPEKIKVEMQHLTGLAYIMWLTMGPTYSFKDYAGRFYAVVLNHFLQANGRKKVILIATSGDTGPALAHALYGRDNVDVIVFYPKGSISEGQRRQITTLKGNVHAIAVNGTFDVCQELAKHLLNDKEFAREVFGDPDRFGSANSISLGRLLPQAVYPFFAYSRIVEDMEPFIPSIPSGNFGDMMGTVLAREMGLPMWEILCALNENSAFLDFLNIGKYSARGTIDSPSSAMNVGHPNNLARLVDFYDGHMYDKMDGGKPNYGIIDKKPDMGAMSQDIKAISVSNAMHFVAMKEAYERYGVLLDPHGAVGYMALKAHLKNRFDIQSVIYETADPGKFPDVVKKATGVVPPIPRGMQEQAALDERIRDIGAEPDLVEVPGKKGKIMRLSDMQVKEAKALMHLIALECKK